MAKGEKPKTSPNVWHLRKIREHRDLTIAEVSAISGISYHRVADLDRGNFVLATMHLHTLVRLARALRCRPTDLIPGLGGLLPPIAPRPTPAPLPKTERKVAELIEVGSELAGEIGEEEWSVPSQHRTIPLAEGGNGTTL